MINTARNVKCKECGRTLPGPPRDCDVCGGKMTYREAEVYHTPGGVIPKDKMGNKTRSSSSKSDSPAKFDSISKLTKLNKPSMNQNTNPYSPNKKDSKEKNGKIKAVVESIGLEKPKFDKNYEKESSKGKKVLEGLGGIVGIIIAILIFAGNLGGDDYGSDYASNDTYIDEIRVMENYELYATNVNHTYFDFDDGDGTVGIDFEVEVTNSEDIIVDLEKDFEVTIDGEVYSLRNVYVSNNSLDDSDVMEEDENKYILKPDYTYYFYVVYDFYQEEWYEIEVKHNFGKGLENRDPEKDILIEND